jgi:site-specific recombinase XerD
MKIGEIRGEIILAKETALMSKMTIMSYENVLNQMEKFFGKDKECETVTLVDIKDYILSKKNWKRSSLSKHIQIMKTVFSYLEENKLIKVNVMNRVKSPKNEEIPVDFLTISELEALDKASMTKVIDSKRRAIYWIVRETGLRASEVGSILLKDIDLEKNIIFVRKAKGGKTKTVPFSNHTQDIIKQYLLENPPKSVYLFSDRWGDSALGRVGVSQQLDDIYDKAFDLKKWKKKRGAHLLRHACATEWVANNGNLKGLQFIMGWNSLKMCDRYVHMSPEILTDMFDEVRNNKKQKGI